MTIARRVKKVEKAFHDALNSAIEAERSRVGDEVFNEVLAEVEAEFKKMSRFGQVRTKKGNGRLVSIGGNGEQPINCDISHNAHSD